MSTANPLLDVNQLSTEFIQGNNKTQAVTNISLA